MPWRRLAGVTSRTRESSEAITVVLDERTGFFLDPADTTVYVEHDFLDSDWIEFWTLYGISVVIEATRSKDRFLRET